MLKVHRIGLTQVSASDPASNGRYRVNIVFVHGLRGHARKTWETSLDASDDLERPETPNQRKPLRQFLKWKRSSREHEADNGGASSSNRVFWPADFLDHDLPSARIWTYGYNADVIGMFEANNKNNVSQHGQDLSVQLERDIQNEDPMIFIVHSLGGIIIKDALRRSQQIRSQTRSVIFLGTPHRGSDLAAWGTIASKLAKLALKDSNNLILETLKVNGEVFDYIQEEFQSIVLKGGIKVHSFQEARGISGMKGLSGKVVDDFSSKLGLGKPYETVETIDANHIQMARCQSKDDPQYRAILNVLKQLIRRGLYVEHHVEQTNEPNICTSLTNEIRTESVIRGISESDASSRQPKYHIQLDKNTRFVGRTTVLNTLEEKLFIREECRTIALAGLGGVGKTQVALQFVYRTKEQYPEYSIFWVAALSNSTFEQAYTGIANKLGVQRSSDDEDIKEALCQYLSSEKAGKWLLVVDNVDDPTLMFGSATRPGILKFLPSNEHGRVLLTTRSREVAVDFAQSDVIDVEKMAIEEAKRFLEKSLIQKDDMQDHALVVDLLQNLACLPLAIAQAAAFINQTKTTVTKYLQLLNGAESEMAKLFSREFRDRTRYDQSHNAVAKTWVVSFEQIQRSNQVAVDLIAYLSCIEPKAIPQSILPNSQTFETESALGVLCAYSFLTRRGSSEMFDMHSLVHFAARVWIREQGHAETALEEAIVHLASSFPSVDRSNKDIWREYLPHTFRVLERSQSHIFKNRFYLLNNVGLYLYIDRRFKEAIRCYEEICYWSRSELLEDDDFRLTAEYNLAGAYLNDRQINKAINMLEHVVAIRKDTLDEKDHSRLTSEHELARAYLNDRQINKAIEMLERVVAIRKDTLDEKDQYRLSSEHVLARAYLNSRQINKAIEMLEHVVAIQKDMLDEKDQYRLTSEHQLARAYLNGRQINKAIEMLEHVVAIRKDTLDEKDQYRLSSKHQLARAYLDGRQINKAIEMLEHVVAIQKDTLDETDQYRLTSEHQLARAYLDDRQINKAIDMLEHVVAIRKDTLDEKDQYRLSSERVLASAYLSGGQTQKAIHLLEHVVAMDSEIFQDYDSDRYLSLDLLQDAQNQLKAERELSNTGSSCLEQEAIHEGTVV